MFPRLAVRKPLHQCLRQLHTTSPRYSSNIDWKSPLRTLGIRNPASLVAGGLALTFFITFPFWFKQPLPPEPSTTQNDDLPAPVRGNDIVVRSVIDTPIPSTENFPSTIKVDGNSFRLVAWGVRTVSFLRVQVYNVALYIPEREFEVLPTYAWSHVNLDPWSTLIRIYSYPLILRIIPVRNTDYAHLRDGFVRSTMTRLRKFSDEDETKAYVEDSITKFKSLFPKSKLKKGEVLSIMQDGPELKLFVGKEMEEELGSVKNDDLARGLMSAYLVGDNVVSPDLQKKLRTRVLQIADQQKEQL
jgi:Chalcone isomerase like